MTSADAGSTALLFVSSVGSDSASSVTDGIARAMILGRIPGVSRASIPASSGIGGGGNLGDPRFVNFELVGGNQYFSVGDVAGPCPDPTGACCFDVDCSDLTETDCLALGGEYKGDGSFCNGDPAPCAPEPCEGDVNGDGVVNVSDVLTVIGNWGCAQ